MDNEIVLYGSLALKLVCYFVFIYVVILKYRKSKHLQYSVIAAVCRFILGIAMIPMVMLLLWLLADMKTDVTKSVILTTSVWVYRIVAWRLTFWIGASDLLQKAKTLNIMILVGLLINVVFDLILSNGEFFPTFGDWNFRM